MALYDNIFQPIDVGGVTIKNRIRRLRFENGEKLTKLYLTLARKMGLELPSFNDSNQTLAI